ncbi:hypothetical protein Q8A73_011654 [Channa argus]|nr:hypothetical protein Q8A73_011654 [Channa argus]
MVDITAHLNTLNIALQGKGRTALHMLEEVLAFKHNLTVLARDLQKGTLSHFPNLREFKEAHVINSEYLHSAIIAMQTSFGKRFCEFREEKTTLSFPVTPLSFDPSLLNVTALASESQPDLEMELGDIADKDIWVSNSCAEINKALKWRTDTSPMAAQSKSSSNYTTKPFLGLFCLTAITLFYSS